jgi:hypothetical protein
VYVARPGYNQELKIQHSSGDREQILVLFGSELCKILYDYSHVMGGRLKPEIFKKCEMCSILQLLR